MKKKRFKLGDFILIPINGEYKIKIISNDKKDLNSVNLYFVNYICKNEIIYKWQPIKNELCWFGDDFFNDLSKDRFIKVDENGRFVSENYITMPNLCPCCAEKEPFIEVNDFEYCEPYLGQEKPYFLNKRL